MTSIMAEPRDWGERMLAERERGRRRRQYRLVIAFAAVAVGVPFAAGVIDGITDREGGMPLWTTWAMLAGWVAIVPAALWWGWRDADEMERAAARSGFAAVGVAALLLVPAVELLADASGRAGLAGLGWHLAVMAGIVTFLYQRWRA